MIDWRKVKSRGCDGEVLYVDGVAVGSVMQRQSRFGAIFFASCAGIEWSDCDWSAGKKFVETVAVGLSAED